MYHYVKYLSNSFCFLTDNLIALINRANQQTFTCDYIIYRFESLFRYCVSIYSFIQLAVPVVATSENKR